MLNIGDAIAFLALKLKTAEEETARYSGYWREELAKVKDRDATIAEQHVEIVRLNEELSKLRESGTIITCGGEA